jgi:uncharacterized LabA/DUF88 family protein
LIYRQVLRTLKQLPPHSTCCIARAGLFFVACAARTHIKRAIIFVDGQNLFYAARKAFGYTYPNVDPLKLAQALCVRNAWQLVEVRFYTGVPDREDDPIWHHFWAAKKLAMVRAGVFVYSRPLRYRNKVVKLSDGSLHSLLVGEEKGIDVRLALDIITLAHKRAYDVAFVLSQDQDLSEATGHCPRATTLD